MFLFSPCETLYEDIKTKKQCEVQSAPGGTELGHSRNQSVSTLLPCLGQITTAEVKRAESWPEQFPNTVLKQEVLSASELLLWNCPELKITSIYYFSCFPCSSEGKESACSVGHLGLIPGSGRSPAEGSDSPLQYSCLENSIDREAWWATYSPRDHKEWDTAEWLTHFETLRLAEQIPW